MRNRRGFTIVELAVVVLSLVLLAAALVPAVGYATQQQAGTSCIQNLRDIGAGFQFYVADWGAYPAYNTVAPPNSYGVATIAWNRRLEGQFGSWVIGPRYLPALSSFKCQAAVDRFGAGYAPTCYQYNGGSYTHYSANWPGFFCPPEQLMYPEQTFLMYERWYDSFTAFSPDTHDRYRNILFVSGAVKGCSELPPSVSTNQMVWTDQLRFGCLKQGTSGHAHPRIPSFRVPDRNYR